VTDRGAGAADTGPVARPDPVAELARLFDEHADGLVRGLVAAGYPDASDAVQEAFVQAVVHWRRVHRYDEPLVWIRRVAINKARNRVRNRRRQVALQDRLVGGSNTVVTHEGPDDDVIAAIALLPMQQREVVALFYYSDLSVAQVAAVMNISEGTVKSHLHAARARVAAILGVDP
jgi:RNA polymerase sigma-70 factor (ECF subfamily)